MSVKIYKDIDNNLEYKFIFIKRFEDDIKDNNLDKKNEEIINKNELSNNTEILDDYPKPNN